MSGFGKMQTPKTTAVPSRFGGSMLFLLESKTDCSNAIQQHNLRNVYTEYIVKAAHMRARVFVWLPAWLAACVCVCVPVLRVCASGSIYQGPAPSRLFRVEVDEVNSQRSPATAKTLVMAKTL